LQKERARQRSTHQAVRLGSAISVEPDQAATGGGAGGRQLVYMDDYSSCTGANRNHNPFGDCSSGGH